VLLSMYVWFRDISRESLLGYHTFNVQWNIRSGFLLFIISEIMLFFSFFWAYFHSSIDPSIWLGDIWPPEGIVHFFLCENIADSSCLKQANTETFFQYIQWGNNRNLYNRPLELEYLFYGVYQHIFAPWFNAFPYPLWCFYFVLLEPTTLLLTHFNLLHYNPVSEYDFSLFDLNVSLSLDFHVNLYDKGLLIDPFKVPLLNTLLLLTSGATLTLSHLFLRLEKFIYSMSALAVTIILAVFFIFIQLFEFVTSPFSINDSLYGNVFFILTGFHGFHVLIGTIFLTVCLIRMYSLHFTRSFHFGFEAAIWYWHFVDVVWIFLYIFVYIWPSAYFFNKGCEGLHFFVPEPGGGITYFNELSINAGVDTIFGTSYDNFDYRDIQDYSIKKKNIEYVANSEYVIKCAKGYEKIVDSKIVSQCRAINPTCLPEELTEFFYTKYKKIIWRSSMGEHRTWANSFCKNVYFFEVFKNNISGSEKDSLLMKDFFSLKNDALASIIRSKFVIAGSEILTPRYLLWYL
jgi:heme/copper-type cytochrome/quinol oxidase subunit 3